MIPVIIDGTFPDNFPPALRFELGPDGALTDVREERLLRKLYESSTRDASSANASSRPPIQAERVAASFTVPSRITVSRPWE